MNDEERSEEEKAVDFRAIAEQQGWSESTQLHLVLRFVQEQGYGPVLDTWCQQVADRESEDDEPAEEPDTYQDRVDGHWYVVSYGARPQVHALDCVTCAEAPEGAWVVVHEVGREYGGPEEGGWWYDTGRVVYRRRVMPDESQADQLAQAERLFDTTTSHRFSMSRRGTDYRASVGSDRGEDYPEVRPHYE